MKIQRPRSGSMQFWPRKRSKKSYPVVKAWPTSNDAKLKGFGGYKVGMTHVIATDMYKNSMTKGQDVSVPVTVIECPPLKVAYLRFYNKDKKVKTQIMSSNVDKELGRKINLPKKTIKNVENIKLEDYSDITAVVYSQPKLTGIGKKKPELFEIAIGGKINEKFDYLKDKLGKDIPLTEIFKDGDVVDFHTVTKGKGFQGPVKRFGLAIRSHKSEKVIRGPGSLGGWKAQGHVMYRVAHAGQMGFHVRTEYNKSIVKIGTKPEEINPKEGFMHYGNVKNQYILIKGSVGGSKKRFVRFNLPIRPSKKIAEKKFTIQKVSMTRK